MTLLSIIVGGLVLLAAGVSPLIVGAVCAITLFAIGALSLWSIVADFRYTQRRAHAAFVREVVRQHQRANEARQATERA